MQMVKMSAIEIMMFCIFSRQIAFSDCDEMGLFRNTVFDERTFF